MVLSGNVQLFVLSAVVTLGRAAQNDGPLIRVPKQAHSKGALHDQTSAETGFGGGGGGGGVENSKYFHYQHLPEHDKYEFGYRRGNDHHVRERYEKAIPHEGHFKTKVRWADKKGGHGEHYWDYNHAGHHDDGEGGYSDPVPSYADTQRGESSNIKVHQKRQSEAEVTRHQPTTTETNRREFKEEISQPQERSESSRGDFFEEQESQERDGFVKSFEDEIGGVQSFEIQKESPIRKRAPELPRPENYKKEPQLPAFFNPNRRQDTRKNKPSPQLFFDLETGKVIDEASGKVYILQPL